MKPAGNRRRSNPRDLDPLDVIYWAGAWRTIVSLTYMPKSQTLVVLDGYPRPALLGPFALVWVIGPPRPAPLRPEVVPG